MTNITQWKIKVFVYLFGVIARVSVVFRPLLVTDVLTTWAVVIFRVIYQQDKMAAKALEGELWVRQPLNHGAKFEVESEVHMHWITE